jgi:hypothetical protein
LTNKKPKINLKIWIPVAAVVLIIIISLVLLLGSDTRVAFLNIEEGDVEVDTGKGWISAIDGMDLSLEDKVRTLEGKAVVILYESILVQLDENTEISIEELSKKNVKVRQESGSTWNKFMAIAGVGGFEVETPNTVATVRGTEFWDDMESVGVAGGKVGVEIDGKITTVESGFKVMVDGAEVLAFDDEDWQRVVEHKLIILKHLKKLRQEEIDKHPTTYNMIKKSKGWTDADVKRYIDRLDNGEFDEDSLKEKTVLPMKSVEKFAELTKEIKKHVKALNRLKSASAGFDGESTDDAHDTPIESLDDVGEAGMPPDPLERDAMPPDPLDSNPMPPPPPAAEPFCGDGTCDPDENCDSCYNDCACKSPAECHEGECVVPECGSDGECADDDPCTVDKCYFAQHVNAYCGQEPLKSCRDNDGCCPKNCNANIDEDCEPDCGNEVCETGETVDDCARDCEVQPDCGDGRCDSGEDFNSCPADCT